MVFFLWTPWWQSTCFTDRRCFIVKCRNDCDSTVWSGSSAGLVCPLVGGAIQTSAVLGSFPDFRLLAIIFQWVTLNVLGRFSPRDSLLIFNALFKSRKSVGLSLFPFFVLYEFERAIQRADVLQPYLIITA